MKKRYITAVGCLLAAVLTSLCAISQARQQRLAEKLIRLHVVANSDTENDPVSYTHLDVYKRQVWT